MTVAARVRGEAMGLVQLIEEFNRAGEPKIDLHPSRDGRVGATLPRLGREILVEGSAFKEDVRVTSEDLAALVREVTQALAPGLALLNASLEAFDTGAAAPEPEPASN
jgi:hypothetical protein